MAIAASSIDPEEALDQLLTDLGSRRGGLTSREAARRLEQHGRNVIEHRRRAGRGRELARQFTHPLALLLWAAAVLALVGGIPPLAIAIVAVIVVNAVFAFAQELQAERATEALRDLLPPRAHVMRDDRAVEVGADELVPGDLLLVDEGDRLSVDARMVDGALELDMSPLTGESQPVARSAERSRPAPSPLEADDLIFAGSLCTAGEGRAVAFATGMTTQLGRIAALSQRVQAEISPLQRQVNDAAELIAAIAVAIGLLFLAVGTLVAGLPLDDAVTFAIGLLVANVPEGLLPTITLALAVGVRRMARRKALVKRLTAVETLGSTDVICTDKTGTLTEGRMAVLTLWSGGDELRIGDADPRALDPRFRALAQTGMRCNNASAVRVDGTWRRGGDPSESALLTAAAACGLDVEAAQVERDSRRSALYHFDSRLKRMTTLDREGDGSCWFHAKGAPLELLALCSRVRTETGDDRPLTGDDRDAVRAAFEGYAARGLRVLGFAERRAGDGDGERTGDGDPSGDGARGAPGRPAVPRERAEADLTFLGLAALRDPPRPEVAGAVTACRHSGIRVIVVTGDHGLTATAVAREVGIVTGEPRIVAGPDVDAMGDADLDELLRGSPELIVARSTPEAKLRIVDALRSDGHTVAMTGDGVNDAPALRRADIGVAMGASGTEVAREAATMVLTDDNFASIVAAIEEGRVVYENTRKFVTYIFAHSTPEVVPFLLFALSGGAIPLPITALQILAIDLGTETLPALALGREPAEPGIMDRPPRPRGEGIITRPMLVRAWLTLGLLEAALVTGGFLFVLLSAGWSPGDAVGSGSALHGDYLAATTMTFAGITACQIGTAFATRTSRASLRSIGVLSNRLLLWGIAFELAVAAAIVYLPPLQDVFATAALGPAELALLAVFPFVVWGSDELRRAYLRRRPDRARRRRTTRAGARAAARRSGGGSGG